MLKALLILTNEGVVCGEVPLFKKLLNELRDAGLAGASVFKGLMGFGRHGGFISSDPFHGHGDSPIAILVIDEEEKIKKAQKLVRSIYKETFMVVWDVSEPVDTESGEKI